MPKRPQKAFLLGVITASLNAYVQLPALAEPSTLERAMRAENLGNFEEAVPLFRQAISEDTTALATQAREHLYPLLVRFHRYDEAQQIVDELSSSTHDPRYRVELARLLQARGEFYSAQRQWQEIASAQPNNEEAVFALGQCLESTGNYDAAKDYYSRVSNSATTFGDQARQRLMAMKTGKSTSKIDEDVEIGVWPASRMPIKVFIEDGAAVQGFRDSYRRQFVEAVEAWNRVAHGAVTMQVVNSKDGADITVGWAPALGIALGVTHPEVDAQGHFLSARIELAVAVDQSGRRLPAESAMTRALYEGHERMMHDVSLHELGHALGLDHSPHSDDIMANGIYGLNAQDLPTARDLQQGDVSRLMRLYGNNGETAATFAVQTPQTVPQPRARAAGSSAPVRNVRAGIDTHSGAGAKHYAPKPMDSIQADLDNALFSMNAGDYPAAADDLNEVIRQNPRNAKAHYLLAIAYVGLRKYDKAGDEYRAVLKLVPTGKLAELAHTGLAKIAQP